MFKKSLSLADILSDLAKADARCGTLRVALEDEQVRHSATGRRLGTAVGDLARAKDEIMHLRTDRTLVHAQKRADAAECEVSKLKGEVRRLGQRGDNYKVKTHALLSDLEKANSRIRVLERDRMCVPYGARPIDPAINTLFGRSFEEWSRIDYVMKASRASVQDIENQLRGRRFGPVTDPTKDLEVYDRENQKRHLGTIIGGRERFARFAQGPAPIFCIVEPRIAPVSYLQGKSDHLGSFCEYRYEFRIGYRQDGWDQKAVLLTEAPLKELVKLTYFRLPGETPEQHYERSCRTHG